MNDRIYFVGNPWPNGHKIIEFVWSGRLEPESGLWFDLHLRTEDYYADDPEDEDDEEDEDDDEGDWKAKGCWGNYHRCTLSSTYWDNPGIQVGSADHPFDFLSIDQQPILVDSLDTLDYDFEKNALHIYLMGHDAVADHRISFERKAEHLFSLNWTGKIALAYVGSEEFRYDFQTKITDAKFTGFRIPRDLDHDAATRVLNQFVTDPSIYVLVEQDGHWVFALK